MSKEKRWHMDYLIVWKLAKSMGKETRENIL